MSWLCRIGLHGFVPVDSDAALHTLADGRTLIGSVFACSRCGLVKKVASSLELAPKAEPVADAVARHHARRLSGRNAR